MNNLRNFNARLKMQQAVMSLLIHQFIDEKDLSAQRNMFEQLDLNGDGMLQRDELVIGFRNIYGEVVEEEIDQIMALADLNGNGELDYSEWLVATAKRSDILNKDKLMQAFQYFDKDGSGQISLDELKDGMGDIELNQGLDDGVYRDILNEADQNKDGEIDFEEF